jgi:hypothetical protein
VEGARPLGREDLGSDALGHAMWEGKLQILSEKLLEVWTPDVGGLLDFDNLEDLFGIPLVRPSLPAALD